MTRKQKRAFKRATVVQVSFLRPGANDYEDWYEFKVRAVSPGDLHNFMIQHLKNFFLDDLRPYIDKIKLEALRMDNQRPAVSIVQQEVIVLRLV